MPPGRRRAGAAGRTISSGSRRAPWRTGAPGRPGRVGGGERDLGLGGARLATSACSAGGWVHDVEAVRAGDPFATDKRGGLEQVGSSVASGEFFMSMSVLRGPAPGVRAKSNFARTRTPEAPAGKRASSPACCRPRRTHRSPGMKASRSGHVPEVLRAKGHAVVASSPVVPATTRRCCSRTPG